MCRLQILLSITLTLTYLFLVLLRTSQAVVQLGEVKCMYFVNFSLEFHDAHRSCWEKKEKELKAAYSKEAKGKGIPYPVNSTIEEFEWDDGCIAYCVYETVGILGKDGELPEPADTKELFAKGKVSDKAYETVITGWNECLEITKRVAKKKEFNNCKIVTHHQHCTYEKAMDKLEAIEVAC